MTNLTLRTHSRWTHPFLAAALLSLLAAGCAKPGQTVTDYRNDLSKMTTTRVTINNQSFNVWLAANEDQRERGLMQVTESDLAPVDDAIRGMLFVFPDEQFLSFWMYNTITPLDIAFIDADGRIVKTHTMAPLETRLYPSVEPAQFALEVLAGTFDRLHIAAGDHVEIPDSVLKDVQ
jgi:uncharacterized membrane protein (UPF0127 family)